MTCWILGSAGGGGSPKMIGLIERLGFVVGMPTTSGAKLPSPSFGTRVLSESDSFSSPWPARGSDELLMMVTSEDEFGTKVESEIVSIECPPTG